MEQFDFLKLLAIKHSKVWVCSVKCGIGFGSSYKNLTARYENAKSGFMCLNSNMYLNIFTSLMYLGPVRYNQIICLHFKKLFVYSVQVSTTLRNEEMVNCNFVESFSYYWKQKKSSAFSFVIASKMAKKQKRHGCSRSHAPAPPFLLNCIA